MTRRLLLSYLSITVLVVLMLEVPLGVVFDRRERERFVAALRSDATVISTFAEDQLEGDPPTTSLAERVQAYEARTSARVVVVDGRGIAFVDSSIADPLTSASRDLSNRPEIVQALKGQVASGSRHSQTLGRRIMFVATPISSGGRVLGAVRITAPTTVIDERVRGFVIVLVALGAIVVAVVAGIGLMLARSVTRPTRDLERAAQRLAAGELDTRVPATRGPVELRALATEFNRMADQVTSLIESQRSLVADASHQLRTPLTALRLQLENLRANHLARGDDEDLEAALGEVARLQRLVDGLLSLARSDARQSPARSTAAEALDPAPLITRRVDLWSPLADERHVHFQVELLPRVLRVNATAGDLEQILDNLIANALEVAPDDSVIDVFIHEAEPSGIEVHVADRGTGLSDEQRVRAFDRFWRGPGATSTSGSGLGLSIVRQLAEANGGTAELRARAGGGVDAVVTLVGQSQAMASEWVMP